MSGKHPMAKRPRKKPAKKPRTRRIKSRRRSVRLLRTGLKVVGVLILISLVQVAALRFINPPFTVSVIWDATRHLISRTPYQRPHMAWRSLDDISPHLQRAVLAAEDQRFQHHNGFDLVEIQATLEDMITDGRLRGASTISMQTARTVFLPHARAILRKALEAYYTVLVELLWDKRRILEIYLNTVDWGDGIMGAEAAGRAYFDCSAQNLTARQAALLAAILPSPHRFSPTRPTRYLRQRARRIAADMPRMPLL